MTFRSALRAAATLVPAPWRYGARYIKTARWLAATDREPASRRRAHADAALARTLEFARDRMPVARRWGLPAGPIPPAAARALLGSLPTSTKEELQSSLKLFTATGVPAWRREYFTTGGSTGLPFGFYHARGDSREERAFIHDCWSRLGWRPGMPTAVVRGSFVPEPGKLFRWDPYHSELHLSGYHLTAEHAPRLLEVIAERKIRFIQAYPSAAVLLARLIRSGVARPPAGLRGLFLGSETLLSWQRALVEDAFAAPAISWYGHAEAAAFATECLTEPGFHVDERYGIVELLGEDGRVVTEPDVPGEIVATGLRRRVTLFLRFRTGDRARWLSDTPCACGRPGPRLAAIEGRVQEFVIADDGRPVSATAINMHNDVFDRVLRFQFRQDMPGLVRMLLLPAPGFGDEDRRRIAAEIGAKLGKGFHLVLETVHEIPLTARGKQRFIDQRLALDEAHVPQLPAGALGATKADA